MIHIHILQQKPGERFYKPGLQVWLSKSSQEHVARILGLRSLRTRVGNPDSRETPDRARVRAT